MPTLPLYTPNGIPDASHRVIAPGGYEWWHFDAESEAGDLQVVARLGAGFGSDPRYLARYTKYRRRPTRHSPPVPSDYPCALTAVFERGRLLAGFKVQPRPQEYAASDHRPEVRVGANHFMTAADDSIELQLSDRESALSVELTFRPLLRHMPYKVKGLDQQPPLSDHYWIVAQPLCEVAGRVQLSGGARQIAFRGRGYHDHCVGTAPMYVRACRSMRGRVLFGDRILAFRISDADSSGRAPDARAVEADVAGIRELAITHVARNWPGRVPKEVQWPQELRLTLEGREELRLYDPVGLSYTEDRDHVIYHGAAGTVSCAALCDIEYYGRVRSY